MSRLAEAAGGPEMCELSTRSTENQLSASRSIPSGPADLTPSASAEEKLPQANGSGDGNEREPNAQSALTPQPVGVGPFSPRSVTLKDHLVKVHKYEGVNPFVHRISPRSRYQMFKTVIFTVTLIAPIRFLMVILSLMLASFFGWLATLGLSIDTCINTPLSPFRRILTYPIRFAFRCCAFFAGFYWINVKDHRKEKKPYSVIAINHVSAFDPCKIIFDEGCSFAAKEELYTTPLLQSIFKGLQGLPIYRGSTEGRQKSMEMLKARTRDSRFDPLLIFPEGTCSIDSVLTMFKPGAFLGGQNVLPVCVNYSANKFFDNYLGWDYGPVFYLYLACCQFVNFLTVEYLEVHEPCEAERGNPALYAENVRRRMADALGAKCTQHDFADIRLYLASQKSHIKVDFVAKQLKDTLNMDAEETTKLMTRFKQLSRNTSKGLDFSEFCERTRLPPRSTIAKRLFALLDSEGDGVIDFTEYLAAMSVCTKDSASFVVDRLQLVFLLADPDGQDCVTRENFQKVIALAKQSLLEESASVANDSKSSSDLPSDVQTLITRRRRSSVQDLPSCRELDQMVELAFPHDEPATAITFADFANRLDSHSKFGIGLLKVFLLKKIGGL